MEYGIQMFSVRDTSEKDLEGTLKKLAEIGYKNIEFAGFFGHTAEEVKKMLDDNGLTVSGSHSSLKDLVENYEETVAFHKAIGNKNYILPWAPLGNKEEIDKTIAEINEVLPKLEQDGMVLSYHNHSHEFEKTADGYVPYDELVKRTDIKLEIDTYWVYNAKLDPIKMMEEMKDRLVFIHIKDGFENGEGKPLGLATAPVAEVYKKAAQMNVPMVVESETLTPDGMTEAKICFEYLKTQE